MIKFYLFLLLCLLVQIFSEENEPMDDSYFQLLKSRFTQWHQQRKSSPQDDNYPEQIHISLTGHSDQMLFIWITWSNTSSTVAYGTQSGKLVSFQNGSTHTYDSGSCLLDYCGWKGIIHVVVIQKLSPSTRYYYRVGDGQVWSDEFYFITQSSSRRGVTVAAFGDMGTYPLFEGKWTTDRLIEDQDYIDLIIHAGDISYEYGYQFIWDEFCRQIQPLSTMIPYMTGVGNHESPYEFAGYLNRFIMPSESSGSGTLFWYSFDFEGIHFISVSTEHPGGAGSEQNKWLIADLEKAVANRKITPWIVLFGHKPAYCSNTYASCSDMAVRNNFEELLYKYDVDLAIWGHVHAYERTYPVYKNNVIGTYSNPKATVHILAGMAGASCCGYYWTDPQPSWSAYRYSGDWGYTRFTVFNDTTLHFEFVTNWNGDVSDEFWMTSKHDFS